MIELFRMFPDDEISEAWFVERRWKNGVHCPHCGSTNVQSGAKHKTMPYRCREKECAKRFSAKTGTVMEGSKLGFSQHCRTASQSGHGSGMVRTLFDSW